MGVYPGRENCPCNTCTKLNVVLPAMVAQCLQRFAAEPRGGRLDSRQHFNEGQNGEKKERCSCGPCHGVHVNESQMVEVDAESPHYAVSDSPCVTVRGETL